MVLFFLIFVGMFMYIHGRKDVGSSDDKTWNIWYNMNFFYDYLRLNYSNEKTWERKEKLFVEIEDDSMILKDKLLLWFITYFIRIKIRLSELLFSHTMHPKWIFESISLKLF